MRSYSEHERTSAVAAFIESGTIIGAAKATGFPKDTIYAWRRSDRAWWEETCQKIRELYEEEYRAKWRSLIMRGAEEALERLENGDEVIDTKSGELRRVKIKGKDAATIAAIAADKMRLSLGLPTSISAKTESQGDKLEALRQAARAQAIANGDVAEMRTSAALGPDTGGAEHNTPQDKPASQGGLEMH